jgi:hypothetical protein
MQPEREFSPSKSKQNQAKKLGFPWFYSSESGLFKGLRAKKQKNRLTSQVVCKTSQALTHIPANIARRPDSVIQETISLSSNFVNIF